MQNSPQSSTQFVDLDNARLEEQKKVMEKIIAEGHCPFCRENLMQYHKAPILKEGKYWMVTPNQWPYENIKYQFLLIYTKHAEKLSDLDPAAGSELLEFFAWLEKEYQVPGGGVCMRFGDSNYSAGTVLHIHAQFIVPDINKEGYEPVRFKIGKRKK
jgi:ATP adenylyltransferase